MYNARQTLLIPLIMDIDFSSLVSPSELESDLLVKILTLLKTNNEECSFFEHFKIWNSMKWLHFCNIEFLFVLLNIVVCLTTSAVSTFHFQHIYQSPGWGNRFCFCPIHHFRSTTDCLDNCERFNIRLSSERKRESIYSLVLLIKLSVLLSKSVEQNTWNSSTDIWHSLEDSIDLLSVLWNQNHRTMIHRLLITIIIR